MTELKIDLSERGGAIKPMNGVNNGPVGVGVRTSSNFDTYKALNLPFARNHDASFSTATAENTPLTCTEFLRISMQTKPIPKTISLNLPMNI